MPRRARRIAAVVLWLSAVAGVAFAWLRDVRAHWHITDHCLHRPAGGGITADVSAGDCQAYAAKVDGAALASRRLSFTLADEVLTLSASSPRYAIDTPAGANPFLIDWAPLDPSPYLSLNQHKSERWLVRLPLRLEPSPD